jgi:type IV secretory pathway TrbD component
MRPLPLPPSRACWSALPLPSSLSRPSLRLWLWMPWEEPLQQVLESVQGPVAKIVAVIIIIVTGLTLAFGETAGGFRTAHPDHLRPVDRVCGLELLPVLLLVRRRGADRMIGDGQHLDGFEAPLHRSLAEPILLGGAPRAIAIVNGTVAAALGLGSSNGSRASLVWAVGHTSRSLRQSATRTSRRCSRATCVSEDISHAELCANIATAPTGWPTICPGPRCRARRGPQQGWQLPAHLSVPRPRPGIGDRGRAGLGLRPGEQCAQAVRLGLGASHRGRAPRGAGYPESSFPEAASWLVDEERRGFEAAGTHFESRYHLTLTFLPPPDQADRPAARWSSVATRRGAATGARHLPRSSRRPIARSTCSPGFMPEIAALDDAETLTFLHGTISTRRHVVRVPETPMYLDACSPTRR